MPLNLHPKAIGGTAGSIAGAIATALLAQCGGFSGVLSAIAPVVVAGLPVLGTLVGAYLVPTGKWAPAAPKLP